MVKSRDKNFLNRFKDLFKSKKSRAESKVVAPPPRKSVVRGRNINKHTGYPKALVFNPQGKACGIRTPFGFRSRMDLRCQQLMGCQLHKAYPHKLLRLIGLGNVIPTKKKRTAAV